MSRPDSRNDHHAQFAATPPRRTRSVTRLGVSVEKVVATMLVPTSHHGAAWPLVKNSLVEVPARRVNHTAGASATASEAKTMSQSRLFSCMEGLPVWQQL